MRINKLHAAILAAVAAPAMTQVAQAEWEFNGYVKGEVAALTDGGEFIGARSSTTDTSAGNSSGDVFKSELSARMFINGDIFEDSVLHADINLMIDPDATPKGYRGPKAYTQQDPLRELYIDTAVGDTYIRIGKQQVVWGTADGIKLLDIINPTDYREFVQNTMEDSRIPIWMVNVDVPVGDTGSFQAIIAEHEENKIPGLTGSGDTGHPFIMKGVDSITGKVHGFLNVTPALSRVAASFNNTAMLGGFDVNGDGAGDAQATGLTGFGGLTVDGFANATQNVNNLGLPTQNITAPGLPAPVGSTPIIGDFLLGQIAQNGVTAGDSNGNNSVTNLVTSTSNFATSAFLPGNANSAFEYMPNATFATFNTFAGANGNAGAGAGGATYAGINTHYVKDYPNEDEPNMGFRFKSSMDNGLNYSMNYFYHYSANPTVNLKWRDSATNEALTTVLATPGDFAGNGQPDFADPTSFATTANPLATFNGATVTRSQIPTNLTAPGALPVTVLLRNSAGQYYGAVAPNPSLALSGNTPFLEFRESLQRIHSLGGSFDYALDAGDVPVVIRGEFLYDKDVNTPVVDRLLLGVGDLENSLTTKESDFFRYVIGVDVTVLTNLLVSGQFIQFRNLDYVNNPATCTTATGINFDCGQYTADPATLHMTNGLIQDEENQNFVSLFFSKPFGEAQLGRFNNITMWEDGGGYWNRMDVEYSFSDNLVGTAEWNQYWGDENTMFGQFQKSSNVQVGLKYIF